MRSRKILIELFACHLFNVNKEQVLPPPQSLIPSLADFYKQTGVEKGGGGRGGWKQSGSLKWRSEELRHLGSGSHRAFGGTGGWLKYL